MSNRIRNYTILLALLIALLSCNRSKNPEQSSQRTFASPADAGAALVAAVKSHDQAQLIAIFGPEAKDVLFSGDLVKDQAAGKIFLAKYERMNRWGKIKAGGEILYIGADNYPFAIPLQQNSAGQWYFNTPAGADEILARRIGRDELTAISALTAMADAEHEFFSQPHDGDGVKQYAQKFVSDEGKQNGLYWPASESAGPSPLGDVGDFAKAMGYTSSGSNAQPFNGYLFRILTKQGDKANGGQKDYLQNGKMTGGFAILAYPATYRNSGIMSFIVGEDGVVYQKDLGPKSSGVAAAMTEYSPGDGWKPAT